MLIKSVIRGGALAVWLAGNGLGLSGCATAPAAAPSNTVDEHAQRLADAAMKVADAFARLAIVEQSARLVHAEAITPADLPPDLRLKVNVEYQGDLKPLVYQLARTVGYEVKVYGRSALLTPVTIVAEARSVGEILVDIDYQASYRCDIVLVPSQRVIEIRYVRPTKPRRS